MKKEIKKESGCAGLSLGSVAGCSRCAKKMKRKHIALILMALAVLCFSMLGLSGCNKAKELIAPKNITYDGAKLTWDKVVLAEYYNVQINGGEKKRANTTLYNYDSKLEEFEVTVSAVIEGLENPVTKRFIPLDTVSDITVASDGALDWNDIAGATAYRISVNGKTLPTDATDSAYTELAEGSNRVKVKAIVSADDSYYSLWSEETSAYINTAPSLIKYDGEMITWVGNSSSYEVNINGQKQTVSGTTLAYGSDNRDFSVEIKAVGDHTSSYDSKITSETFHYLAPVTGMTVSDGILSWNAVQNAQGYRLRINGTVQSQPVSDVSYDKLVSGSSLDVEVMPYNASGNYFSVWSEVKSIYILESPQVSWNADLELDGDANNNCIWNSVNGATGYTVEVTKDGKTSTENFSSTQRAFAHAYAQVGTYSIRVKATADAQSDYYDSKFSKELSVERLAAPKPTSNSYITSDAANLSRGFTVSYTAVSNSSGYQLYKDGVLLAGKFSTALAITDSSVADDSVTSQQEYNYIVKSMGGVKNISGKTYVSLPCLTAEALAFKITVQAMPNQLTMAGFNAQWSEVAGSNGYSVKCGGSTYSSSSTSYNLSTINVGNYDVSVCSKGNNGAVLASNHTAPISVSRLSSPTNIKISYGTGEGLLVFDPVSNAKSYQVFLDQSEQALPENAYDNMYQYIKTSGTVLHMESVANYFNDLKTVYYMTSPASNTQQFIRLAAPTFPDGAFANSKELLWSAPSNINTAEYTPTYQVYESGIMQTGGEQNGTKFNVQYLSGGKSYTFRIKAVGNDSKYLDSEMSVTIEIYKLATPQLSIKDGAYFWKAVTNASSYVLEIDGKRVSDNIHVSGSDYSYIPNYNTIGNHTVALYAVGDGGYNNINSNTFDYTQVVKALLAPEISFNYSSDSFVSGGFITVSVTKASANCLKYQYEIAGESIFSENFSASKTIESAGNYIIRAKAVGGVFDAQDIFYIDSQYVGGGSAYTLTLLAPPTLSSFSINSDGAIKWAAVTGALGYDYCISFDGGEYSAEAHSGTASLNPIENFSGYKTIKIKVRVSGNGNNIISSQWVEYTWNNPNK